MFGRTAAACHRAVLHVREGAPDIPVWVFSTTQPLPETEQLCERVCVRGGALALLWQAQRQAWPRWVALGVAPWTGERNGWMLKVAPFLIPPGRALVLNENGDFFAGSPAGIARHLGRRSRDAGSALWNAARELGHVAGDWLRTVARAARLLCLMALGTVLGWLGNPHHRWFARWHGKDVLDVVPGAGEPTAEPLWAQGKFRPAGDRWLLWGAGEATDEMRSLLEDPRTFALSRQTHFRAWKSMIVPTAPFRTLQPGEFSRVLAPVSDTILVDRRKLLALGLPEADLAGTAWMILFWKAAAAGWRSYSIGGDARLKEQPDFPMQETAFFLRVLLDPALRRLGPREPRLSRGAAAAMTGPASFGKKLRVLLVSPFLPYPLSHGGAVRIWNLCRALAPRVDFILVAVREAQEVVEYAKLAEVFREVHIVDIDQRASGSPRLPEQVRRHQSSVMRALIADLAHRAQADLLQIEYTHMAHFRDAAPEIPAILVEHDLTFSLYRQLAKNQPSPEAAAEFERWLEFERGWLEIYDVVWTMSEDDRQLAVRESRRPSRLTFSVPNGVDIERFRPEPASAAQEIFYVGSFRHLPNTFGFEKLEREVMPRVWRRFPEARLRVVAGPRHEQFWKKRELDPRIELHGFVEDLRPLYAGASVVVAPLEVSAGTNIKVLEAMACGRAVVSTPVGCAGLDLIDGVDALVRADWEGFAAAVCELLEDGALRERIAAAARSTAEERFSWKAIADKAYRSYRAVNVALPNLPGSV